MENPNNAVDVKVLTAFELFHQTEFPLAVDTYQRGFVWNGDKIRDLLDDLYHYQNDGNAKLSYYMGTILIHRNQEKKKLFLIDGQQRVTALSLLHYHLENHLPRSCQMTYSPQSAKRIKSAQEVLRAHSNQPTSHVFNSIVFTVITVDRVDLAFTFFDTQNNRGVPLHTTDLLKAYHLRAVKSKSDEIEEDLQTLCACRWEKIQQNKYVLSNQSDSISCLFEEVLFQARCWKGQKDLSRANRSKLLEEFQNQTWPTPHDLDCIPLYRSRHNQLGTAFTFRRDGTAEIHTHRICLSSKPEDLPFSIRQPIHRGVSFFLYVEKYAALLQALTVDATESEEIQKFREVHDKLLKKNSVYLRNAFVLASLLFYDQFGDHKLWEFSLWLEHSLGAIRLEKKQVRYETARNFFKNDSLNLLDVISEAFCPEQVVRYLEKHHQRADVYANEDNRQGAQAVYKQAVLSYFKMNHETSLKQKAAWIKAKLNGGLV